MTTNASLIEEARRIVKEKWGVTLAGRSGETVMALADALETSETQVAELKAALEWESKPADLLAAVDLLDVAHTRGCAHPACAKAVATLIHYGLLKEAR